MVEFFGTPVEVEAFLTEKMKIRWEVKYRGNRECASMEEVMDVIKEMTKDAETEMELQERKNRDFEEAAKILKSIPKDEIQFFLKSNKIC